MRQIKFRAWDAERQEMYGEGHGMMYGQQEEMDDSLLIRFKHFEGEPIFTQYTGLQDRKGKDIYEGDVFDGSYTNPMSKEVVKRHYEIVYEKGVYYARLIGSHPYGTTMLYFENKNGEVIGNIYEHPHLLEVESK